MFKRILIAVNSGPQAAYALEAGIELAQELGAEIALVHVVTRAFPLATEFGLAEAYDNADLRKSGQELLERLEQSVPSHLHRRSFLREGEAAVEIVEVAREWHADLIVTGSHGRGRISQFLLGSTAEATLHHAPCPVMTVRECPDPILVPT